jgi:hypothetical protein
VKLFFLIFLLASTTFATQPTVVWLDTCVGWACDKGGPCSCYSGSMIQTEVLCDPATADKAKSYLAHLTRDLEGNHPKTHIFQRRCYPISLDPASDPKTAWPACSQPIPSPNQFVFGCLE